MTLIIAGRVDLVDYSIPDDERPVGPLFYRWLPNGLADSIKVNIGCKGTVLELYFIQAGISQGGFFSYNDDASIQDGHNLIPHQACLDAGPLFVKLTLNDYSKDGLNAIVNSDTETEAYFQFSKQVIKLIYPHISKLTSILKYRYGQYWILDFDKFDSRKSSLQRYCTQYLHLHWSSDSGNTWNLLNPGLLVPEISPTACAEHEFQQYITKNDWIDLKSKFSENIDIREFYIFLIKAHRSFSSNNITQALIEAVQALEFSINIYLKHKISELGEMASSIEAFNSLSLTPKAAAVLCLTGKFSEQTIKDVLKCIRLRNAIVHEGTEQNEIENSVKVSLLSAIPMLLGIENQKFPRPNIGNKIFNDSDL
ncbi:MAG: hypothetical protein AB7D37_03710 [Desulfovibrio sp.]